MSLHAQARGSEVLPSVPIAVECLPQLRACRTCMHAKLSCPLQLRATALATCVASSHRFTHCKVGSANFDPGMVLFNSKALRRTAHSPMMQWMRNGLSAPKPPRGVGGVPNGLIASFKPTALASPVGVAWRPSAVTRTPSTKNRSDV